MSARRERKPPARSASPQSSTSAVPQPADPGKAGVPARLLARATAVARFKGQKCTATTKDGEPCRAGATARSGYQFCWPHDPALPRDTKLAWAQKGGAVYALGHAVLPEAPDPALREPEAISQFIEAVSGHVLRGEISPSVAQALKGLADSAMRAYEANLARKLADLEALVASRAKYRVRVDEGWAEGMGG